MFSFTRRDVWMIVGVSVVFMAVTAAPYVYGWMQAGSDVYTWTHSLTVGDFFVYYSYIDQMADGVLLPVNLYTAEVTRGILQIVWAFPALLVRLFGISAGLAFHLYRLALIPAFITLLVALLKRMLPDEHRVFQILFVLTSSGLGFFAPLFLEGRELKSGQFSWPMDLWVPEANTFLTLYHSPHILLSTILLVGSLFLFFVYHTEGKRQALYSLFLCTVLLLLFHPFYLPTLFFVLGMYTLVLFFQRDADRRRLLVALVVLVIAALPGIAYYSWLLLNDPAFAQKAEQNILLTTTLPMTLMSYGGLLVLSFAALVRNRHSRTRAFLFLTVWLVVGFVLLYLPVPFQRRLSEGLHIPFAITSLIVLLPFVRRLTRGYQLLLMMFLLIFFAISNIVTVKHDVFLFDERQYALVLPEREYAAATWMHSRGSGRDDVVLAPITIGPWLPGIAGVHVVVGHEIETLDVDDKITAVDDFYSSHGREQQNLATDVATMVWVQDDEELERQLESLGFDSVYSDRGISLFQIEQTAERR